MDLSSDGAAQSSKPSFPCLICGFVCSTKSAFTNHSGSNKCKENVLRRQRGLVHCVPNEAPATEPSCSLLNQAAIPNAIHQKSLDLQRLASKLSILPAHQAYFLLRTCIGVPKMNYLLRASPTWLCGDELDKFDNITKSALEAVTNVKIDGVTWAQASLPVSSGGLGIRRVAELAIPAYLASVYATAPLVSTIASGTESLDLVHQLWQTATGTELPPENLRRVQKVWDVALVQKTCQIIKEELSSDVTHCARLLAVAEPESGKWLNALPVSSLGTLMSDESFRVAVGLRIGAAICRPHLCTDCRLPVDEYGHHGLSCKKSAGRFLRHTALNELIRRSLVTAKTPAVLEPLGTSDEDDRRPDGVSQMPWKNGLRLAWDVTCVDTVAFSNVISSSVKAGEAARKAEDEKRRKYEYLAPEYYFVALAFETFGVASPSCIKFLRELGRRLKDATGERRSYEFLLQRISIEIQRWNALSVTSTVPRSDGFNAVYFVL
ncbi:uncharacterized protein LOC129587383 [Paramacrobiotus metropolitanus]|uniref:uncharacterized protein LOC129587383 n=1 Tax=Paramacrobiotus metropolitanus TaxID=2943436 RepID=UPI002445C0FF|nr:uncharacterized protein LOC129587383 [Paramacrobiotus metropolitanus]